MKSFIDSNPLTIDEIIASISRSSLPSIITEGGDDIIAYRRIEDEFPSLNVNVMAAGGRSRVLEIFERRSEFPSHSRVAFIVDLDLWSITCRPRQFDEGCLICTDGYSLENDLYQDGDLESLLASIDRPAFAENKRIICEWYAENCLTHLCVGAASLNVHPQTILNNPGIRSHYSTTSRRDATTSDFLYRITSQYMRLLRGKTLISLLLMHIHGHTTRGLLDFAASRRGPLLSRIFEEARIYLESISPP